MPFQAVLCYQNLTHISAHIYKTCLCISDHLFRSRERYSTWGSNNEEEDDYDEDDEDDDYYEEYDEDDDDWHRPLFHRSASTFKHHTRQNFGYYVCQHVF